jgi:hypothetical protein
MTATFWTSLASYCQELAPVAGPLLSAVGDTATAVDRAGRSTKALRDDSARLEQLLSAEDR